MALPPAGRYGGSHRGSGDRPRLVSREIRRNGGSSAYRASEADRCAWERALRPKPCRLARHAELRWRVAQRPHSSGRRSRSLAGLSGNSLPAEHRSSEASQRLESIPGIGVIGATAIAATVADPKVFRSGRDLAAWIRDRAASRFNQRQTETAGRSRNRAIAICDVFWWSEPMRC